MSERIRILGIDPGSRLSGFGVLDFRDGDAAFVASGTIQSKDGEFAERLELIFRSVAAIVSDYQPDVVAIETVFMHRNPSSALKLGHARSAAICATFDAGVKVVEYSPREIKQAIVGTGAATKEQIQHMIRAMLNLDGRLSPDAADALAVAVCHGHQRRMRERLSDSVAMAGLR